MVYSKNKELLSYAMKMGCTTAAEFALFLKARALLPLPCSSVYYIFTLAKK